MIRYAWGVCGAAPAYRRLLLLRALMLDEEADMKCTHKTGTILPGIRRPWELGVVEWLVIGGM